MPDRDRDRVVGRCDEIIEEARAASDAVLAHSTLWLTMHPVQHRRLRRRLVAARRDLLNLRRALSSGGIPLRP